MRLIDSNIIIYSAEDEYAYLRGIIKSSGSYTCRISYIEVLGYHNLAEPEPRMPLNRRTAELKM